MSYDAFDRVSLRCSQLGGEVTFAYCRALQEGLPCRQALVCFQYKFPVERYFRLVLREETFERIFNSQPPNRLHKLFMSASQAQKREPPGSIS